MFGSPAMVRSPQPYSPEDRGGGGPSIARSGPHYLRPDGCPNSRKGSRGICARAGTPASRMGMAGRIASSAGDLSAFSVVIGCRRAGAATSQPAGLSATADGDGFMKTEVFLFEKGDDHGG